MSATYPMHLTMEVAEKFYNIGKEHGHNTYDQTLNMLMHDPMYALHVLQVEAKKEGVSLEALCSGLIRQAMMQALKEHHQFEENVNVAET